MSGAAQRGPAVSMTALIAISVVFLAAAYSRNSVWRDNFSIYADSVAKAPGNVNMRLNLGMAYRDMDKLEDAAREFRRAADQEPRYADARNNLANVNLVLGRLEAAAAEYEKVLELDPGHAEARYNLASAYLAMGRHEEAARHFTVFLRIYPEALADAAEEARAELKRLEGAGVRPGKGGARR